VAAFSREVPKRRTKEENVVERRPSAKAWWQAASNSVSPLIVVLEQRSLECLRTHLLGG
jgi:hypothetical protein